MKIFQRSCAQVFNNCNPGNSHKPMRNLNLRLIKSLIVFLGGILFFTTNIVNTCAMNSNPDNKPVIPKSKLQDPNQRSEPATPSNPQSDFEFAEVEGGVAITAFKAEKSKFVPPSKVKYQGGIRDVVQIGNGILPVSFKNFKSVKKIDLRKCCQCKMIEKRALERLPSLETVNLGKNNLHVEQEAFFQCESLRDVYLTKNVTLGREALGDCSNLSSQGLHILK